MKEWWASSMTDERPFGMHGVINHLAVKHNALREWWKRMSIEKWDLIPVKVESWSEMHHIKSDFEGKSRQTETKRYNALISMNQKSSMLIEEWPRDERVDLTWRQTSRWVKQERCALKIDLEANSWNYTRTSNSWVHKKCARSQARQSACDEQTKSNPAWEPGVFLIREIGISRGWQGGKAIVANGKERGIQWMGLYQEHRCGIGDQSQRKSYGTIYSETWINL